MSSHSQVLLLLVLTIICSQGRVVKRQPATMDIFEEFNTLFGHNWWVNVTEDSEHDHEPGDKNNYHEDSLVLAESTEKASEHKLCIIVPFRDRFEELLEFAPYMKKFLDNQAVKNEVWVINQADKFRFNRAYLINVGFQESSSSCDYIGIHDVDLLPMNPDLIYLYPSAGALHLSPPGLHPLYSYPTFTGGILLISRKHYQELDGMSNKYWGWGLEDDEFYIRMKEAGVVIERPAGIRSGSKGSFLHNHSKERKRDHDKCYNQENMTRPRDRQTGLSTTVYSVRSKRQLVVDGAPVTFLDIHLECDISVTPWCNCTGTPPKYRSPGHHDGLTQPSTDGFDQWWSKQKQLKKRIQETCKMLGPSLGNKIKENELKKWFMYDPRHEILYCRNAKVATTTWLTHFLRLSTLSESEKKNTTDVHKRIPRLFPVPDDLDLRKLAKSTTSFSMVRHPFERLVSAYQNKMVEGSDPQYLKVKDSIKEKYGEATFPNFIREILHESKFKCRSMHNCNLDRHWQPYISRCAFCDVPYRVIGKAETFQEDQLFIGHLAGVQLEHIVVGDSGGGISSRDLARQYFGQLDRRTVDRLYRLYQVDFQMFGYSPDLYFSYARPAL